MHQVLQRLVEEQMLKQSVSSNCASAADTKSSNRNTARSRGLDMAAPFQTLIRLLL
jgi:hypothetical protein